MDDCCSDKTCAIDDCADAKRRHFGSSCWSTLRCLSWNLYRACSLGPWRCSPTPSTCSATRLFMALVFLSSREARLESARVCCEGSGDGAIWLFVFGQVVYKLLFPQLPMVETMGAIAALALAANGVCFALLWRHRAEDINMRSVWLCSRNDLIANASVLLAALAVRITLSPWPDIAVGAFICAIFFRSAFLVAREAHAELKSNHAQAMILPHPRKPVSPARAGGELQR